MAGPELMLLGAAAGALTSPKDPLTGAMLGGMAGAAGGAMFGPAAGATAAGTGIGAGGASLPGVMGAANTAAGAAAGTAYPISNAAMGAGTLPGVMGVNTMPSFIPGAAQTAFGSLAPTAGGVIGGGAAAAPSFGQKALNFMNQNPTLTNQGFNTVNNMMQEPQQQFAPPGQVSRGGPIQTNDYMSLLAPQQSPVITPQRLSLI